MKFDCRGKNNRTQDNFRFGFGRPLRSPAYLRIRDRSRFPRAHKIRFGSPLSFPLPTCRICKYTFRFGCRQARRENSRSRYKREACRLRRLPKAPYLCCCLRFRPIVCGIPHPCKRSRTDRARPCRKNGRRDRSIPRRKFRGNNDRLPFPSARADRARGDLTQDTAQTSP